jgi:hypothetical protein
MDRYLKRKRDDSADDDHDGECEETSESKEDSDLKSTGKWKPKYAENRRKGPSKDLIDKWRSTYKWLRVEYDTNTGKSTFFCQWCERSKRKNFFTQGMLCAVFYKWFSVDFNFKVVIYY